MSTKTTCPRCGGDFECNADNITECQCSQITIPPVIQEKIAKEYEGCLCAECLREIGKDAEENPIQLPSLTSNGNKIRKNSCSELDEFEAENLVNNKLSELRQGIRSKK